MNGAARELEVLARVGPFGVRFWDGAEQRFVPEGLDVRAGLASGGAQIVLAPNPSAIFTARGLPGTGGGEFGDPDDGYWSTVVTRSYRVQVADSLGRFLPFAFQARLPAQGLFVFPQSPPGPLADGIELFSSPSRPVTSMRAVIRAELRDVAAGGPAAGAVLAAVVDARSTFTGMADATGKVAIVFPYPEPSDFPVLQTSPPAAVVGGSFVDHTWPVVLSVRYRSVAGTFPAYPDLAAALVQPPAILQGDTAGAPLPSQTLQMGRELVVRSLDAATGTPLPVLRVLGS
jgi:hypothetical protein